MIFQKSKTLRDVFENSALYTSCCRDSNLGVKVISLLLTKVLAFYHLLKAKVVIRFKIDATFYPLSEFPDNLKSMKLLGIYTECNK